MNEIFQKVYLPSSPPTKQALPSPMRLFEEGLLKILLFHGTLPLRFLHMIEINTNRERRNENERDRNNESRTVPDMERTCNNRDRVRDTITETVRIIKIYIKKDMQIG